jgi:CRP-like cAMP-binding protein
VNSERGCASVQSDEALYGLLVRAGQAREVPAGEVPFEKGEAGETMFVLARGSVSLTDGERLLERLEAPGLFGEMALIESAPRALTATSPRTPSWSRSRSARSGCSCTKRRTSRPS